MNISHGILQNNITNRFTCIRNLFIFYQSFKLNSYIYIDKDRHEKHEKYFYIIQMKEKRETYLFISFLQFFCSLQVHL